MVTVSIDPVILSFGHLGLRWYGLIVAAAILIGVRVAAAEAKRRGLTDEDFGEATWWAIVGGFVGARLVHVLDQWSTVYSAAPIRALYFWEGGLAIWGAVIGGTVALAVYTRRRHWRLPLLLDSVAPGLALAQGVGRLACVITGDAVGRPTGGPLGLAYTNPGAVVPELGVFYVPTPLYEATMNLALFALLWRLRRRDLPQGALFLTHVVLYSLGRFVITFWSGYRTLAFGLNQAQLLSLLALAAGLPLLVRLYRRRSPLTGAIAR